jgi:hypothetical protein
MAAGLVCAENLIRVDGVDFFGFWMAFTSRIKNQVNLIELKNAS